MTAETWEAHAGYVEAMARRFLQRRGRSQAEFEELLSLAGVEFVRTLRDYDPQRGAAFRTFLTWRLYGAWTHFLRSAACEASRRVVGEAADAVLATAVATSELSDDANALIRLALAAPGKPAKQRQGAISAALAAGWSAVRCCAAMDEIREAIYR